ncbi:hypothetical protein BH18ACT7_BH18ACT7_25210 [soil metagenome]
MSAPAVEIAGAPSIPGLRFRRFIDERDHAHLLEITNQCWDEDGVGHRQDMSGIANAYLPTAGFDARQDVLFAEVDGRPVAFSRVKHARQADGIRLYDLAGQVLPEWRRCGIGATLFRYAEARQRAVAQTHPEDGPKLLESSVSERQLGARALLEAHGFSQTPALQDQDMVRPTLDDLPLAPMPEGLQVRPARPEHMRQIWELYRVADLDGPGSLETDEDDYERWASWSFWDLNLWQIAWDGEQPVGMVLNFIRPDENEHFGRLRGYTEWINVARLWRRRGVARALIVRSFGVLQERGMHEAALGVYVNNPTGARQLYESLGYRAVRSMFCYRRPL